MIIQEINENLRAKKETALLLCEPTFGWRNKAGGPYAPTAREILFEWVDAINFLKDRKKVPAFLFFLFHFWTAVLFVQFFLFYANLGTGLFFLASVVGFATVINTIWYHRYCSHKSFLFSSPIWPKIFLFMNPVGFREESYVLPHRVHHRLSDKAGDPYGPHLGWLGSYLATESQQKMNVQIHEVQYNQLVKSLAHIGLKFNDFESFRSTGSVENLYFYFARFVFAQVFWSWLICSLLGKAYFFSWYAANFFFMFLLRDFNWRGHGGNFRSFKKKGWEFDQSSRALNQRFYGIIAGEWHDNHHSYPMSANTGFLQGQFDAAFFLIRLFKAFGMISEYTDTTYKFRQRYHLNG